MTDDKKNEQLADIPAQEQEWPGEVDGLSPRPDHGEEWVGRNRLTGKRAIITGGDSGIGRAVAIMFAKEGADVAIVDLPESAKDSDETRAAVEQAGRTCVVIHEDLRERDAVNRAVSQAVEKLGGLDIVVANAAYQMTHDDLAGFTAEQLERTFATNVFGTFWLVQAAEPHLKEGAAVLITTSIQAYDPSTHLLDYAATKGALNNLTVNLATELGEKGIRVNAVAPGPIWTPLIPATMPPKKVEGFGSDTPLGRAGQPKEVAAAFVFLASDEASYVSGTVLGVTGGRAVF